MAIATTLQPGRYAGTDDINDMATPFETKPPELRSQSVGRGTEALLADVDTWLLESDPDDFVVRQPYQLVTRGPKPGKYRSLQQWVGRIIDVGDTTFEAVLVDRTAPGGEELAELFVEDLSPDDLGLLREGAVFYWSIGYRDEPSGSRQRFSEIRLQRLAPWSASDVEDVRREVRSLKGRLGIDAEVSS